MAREAPGKHGIDVVEFGQPDDDHHAAPMPFENDAFDLVVNRHEAYHPAEVARVLAPGETFLTHQVGGDELPELAELLGYTPATSHVTFPRLRAALTDAGLATAGAEHIGSYTFADVAAGVAYPNHVPWAVPDDFTVDRHADQLRTLHARTGGGPVRLTMKRFLLRAGRPRHRP